MNDLAPDEIVPPSERPRKGDLLFRGDLRDWRNNACLDGPGSPSSFAYIEGYRRAADLLAAHVANSRQDQDLLVYPIVFLYRHHLELALKSIIKRLPRLLDRQLTPHENDGLGRHNLEELWQTLKPMVAEIYNAVGWQHEKADTEGAR